jgi:hypothetical protein
LQRRSRGIETRLLHQSPAEGIPWTWGGGGKRRRARGREKQKRREERGRRARRLQPLGPGPIRGEQKAGRNRKGREKSEKAEAPGTWAEKRMARAREEQRRREEESGSTARRPRLSR